MGINILFGILFLKGVQILKFGRHIEFLADLTQRLYKKEDAQRCQKGVSIYLYGYKFFIVHLFFMGVLLMHSETCIALLFLT